MPIMTPDVLVAAVLALESSPGRLVSAPDIMAWCREQRPPIDYGPPANSYFWNSDYEEAAGRHRLLKFKKKPTRTSCNFFARRLGASAAPGPASAHPGRGEARANGWVECAWLGASWDWPSALVPPP
jgi:hypothetical protein